MTALSADTRSAQNEGAVSGDLVQAALRAADKRGVDVADVPVISIAHEAGISRSTLLRRLGGSRVALDDAVRAAGIDPGGQAPVRIRALDAAADLISESGLAAATLDAIAERTGCSVHSIYTAFGSREDLLRAVFDRHGPVPDFEAVLADETSDLHVTVLRLYETLIEAFSRQPRVAPAIIADVLGRPATPGILGLAEHTAARLRAVLSDWLTEQICAGAIRDLPVDLLGHLLFAPLLLHLLTEDVDVPGSDAPDLDTVSSVFASAFLRVVTPDTFDDVDWPVLPDGRGAW